MVRMAGEDRGPVAHQRHAAQVLPESPEVVDGPAHAVEAYTCVQKLLDELELHEVLKGVEALAPGALRGLDAGSGKPRARPVVELAVADPDDLAHLRATVPTHRDRLCHGPSPFV